MSKFGTEQQELGSALSGQPSGERLNQQTAWNDALQRLRSHIIQSDERGLPRYGVLSILARRVPFHLYDHPALTNLCDTAFTDGIHIFINTEFLKEISAEDADTPPGEQRHSLVLILLHELSHILFRHHGRLPANAPPMLWAIACDITINSRLLQAYPQLKPGPVFDDAWGTSKDEVDQYLGQSEEYILHELWEDPVKPAKEFVESLQKSLDENGNADNVPDQRGENQDVQNHMIRPEDLARALDENGLQHVRETLKMPAPNDRAAFESMSAVANLYLTSDFDKAKEIRQIHPTGNAMAGNHLEEAWAEWVENESGGLLEWKNLLRDLLLGEGMRYDHCDEVPNDVYYVEPEQMGLDASLYIGSLAPATPGGIVVCVVDTSQSVSVELLETFVGELNNMIEHECVRENQVYFVSADSSVRSNIEAYSSQQIASSPEKIALQGRGGTDLTRVINEIVSWTQEQQEFSSSDLEAIVYFTDLLDRPPTRDRLPRDLPRLLFLSPPSHMAKTFRKQVEDFAQVAEIRDGTVIDLCLS